MPLLLKGNAKAWMFFVNWLMKITVRWFYFFRWPYDKYVADVVVSTRQHLIRIITSCLLRWGRWHFSHRLSDFSTFQSGADRAVCHCLGHTIFRGEAGPCMPWMGPSVSSGFTHTSSLCQVTGLRCLFWDACPAFARVNLPGVILKAEPASSVCLERRGFSSLS